MPMPIACTQLERHDDVTSDTDVRRRRVQAGRAEGAEGVGQLLGTGDKEVHWGRGRWGPLTVDVDVHDGARFCARIVRAHALAIVRVPEVDAPATTRGE
jgi:hypothetical protein